MTYCNKPITRAQVASYFGIDLTDVEQHGAKQLFTIQYRDTQCLVSYYTIIGVLRNRYWHITRHKYSRTTSKQVSQWAYGMEGIVYIEEEIDINKI